MAIGGGHLLDLESLTSEEIVNILDTARSFREVIDRDIKKVPTLRGITVVNLFYEPSTRTRLSFEIAEKRLSADTINFSKATSSVKKGESLKDTIQNIEAMRTDMVVIRHSSPGAAHFLTQCCDSKVINAGDGPHEHPTQGLLDMFTIRERYGRIQDLRVLIVGDIKHSRVARSNIWGLNKLGAKVAVCGPSTLLPYEIEKMGVEVFTNLDDALQGIDVVNILRIQSERQDTGYFPTMREYTELYGINMGRLKHLNEGFTIMHPGPMNRGVEITDAVAESADSVILEQVTNGVAVRMAVLYLLMQSETESLKDEVIANA
ncbi:MAG: aspartate carbamoyltransferase catalytic subunit [candidate division Zixibacteria bacterium]|nr:aspartate carbamoyltransferase catalytic subunit [candidate division Zixibacteria bacterium]